MYQEEGDKEFTRKEVCNAIYFYTEGIQMNCKDFQLNAKLYSNRATAYYHLGKILILFFLFIRQLNKLLLSLHSAQNFCGQLSSLLRRHVGRLEMKQMLTK